MVVLTNKYDRVTEVIVSIPKENQPQVCDQKIIRLDAPDYSIELEDNIAQIVLKQFPDDIFIKGTVKRGEGVLSEITPRARLKELSEHEILAAKIVKRAASIKTQVMKFLATHKQVPLSNGSVATLAHSGYIATYLATKEIDSANANALLETVPEQITYIKIDNKGTERVFEFFNILDGITNVEITDKTEFKKRIADVSKNEMKVKKEAELKAKAEKAEKEAELKAKAEEDELKAKEEAELKAKADKKKQS